MVFPASGINALGCVYVCGRSFVPAPATGMIAFIVKPYLPWAEHLVYNTILLSLETGCESNTFCLNGMLDTGCWILDEPQLSKGLKIQNT